MAYIETTIIEQIAHEDDGYEVDVAQITSGFSVTIHDTDADEYLVCKVFPTLDRAIAYAETL